MLVENGEWIMRGVDWGHPECIHTIKELEDYVEDIGFLPLFANGVEGFSLEEWTDPLVWWSGDDSCDPWQWREIIARKGKIAYGKFFDKKAGFISLKWFPYFANARRDGYDFDTLYQDGKADRREKLIMDFYMDEAEDGSIIWKDTDILSTELKKAAGFGKNKEKNYPGIMTNLQMNTYLVISDFVRRTSKKGEQYGMAVSIPKPPEKLWGYDFVTSAYDESPSDSWQRIYDHVLELYENADEKQVIKLIGKKA
ncbi:MAG: hypothetical protein K5656_05170 [Lachnospiraceae bacterium]|nr:hypothetical protein [Lachnospiraceae bacterium]